MFDVKKIIVVNKNLILQNILEIKYIFNEKKYAIKLGNNKIYKYNEINIKVYNKYENLNIKNCILLKEEVVLTNIKKVFVFTDGNKKFYKIVFANNEVKDYFESEIKIIKAYEDSDNSKDIIPYFKKVSEVVSIKGVDDSKLLLNKVNKIKELRSDSVICNYLNSKDYPIKKEIKNFTIFPFGCNSGQYKAVNEALNNQLSVIKGPPGTGKTQTILNVMANLIIKNKTMLIVSNNNSAVDNIYEKMHEKNLEFMIAYLGKSENKDKFIKNQKPFVNLDFTWYLPKTELLKIEVTLLNLESKIHDVFNLQEEYAKTFAQIEAIKYEKAYHEKNARNILSKEDVLSERKIKNINNLEKLLYSYKRKYIKNKDIGLINKLKTKRMLKVKLNYLSYKNIKLEKMVEVIYYQKKINELTKKYSDLDKKLNSSNVKNILTEYTNLSLKYLKSSIITFIAEKTSTIFTSDDLWKKPGEILKRYPIVLSSTFSATSSLGRNIIYDYVIMDEASQVDLVTGFLALSVAKAAVVVGDEKQLANIVEKKHIEKLNDIFNSFNVPKAYDFKSNSFLQSVIKSVKNVPVTLLKEHYRCDYKIINFCNQQFYNNELICMNTKTNENSIEAFTTVKGNHARGLFNQREVSVIKKEVLPSLKYDNENDIGIIAPYVKQCELLREKVSINCPKDTVHKFQGREKNTIILSTTSNSINKFIDDKQLINVAVSRAKKKFVLVTTGNEIKKESNIGALFEYIKYNNFTITESRISSIFDYLYKQYENERKNFLSKHKLISKYDSENLFSIMLDKILKIEKFQFLSYSLNVRFSNIVNKFDNLTLAEETYAKRPGTHCDFVIYNKVTKKIVLIIEIDGEKNHRKFSKQYYRDLLKNSILEKNNIPYIRLSTMGDTENKKIIDTLCKVMGT